jgi:hypothetical protein
MQAGAFVWEGTESDTVSVLTVFSKVKTESEFDYNNTTALIEKYFLIIFFIGTVIIIPINSIFNYYNTYAATNLENRILLPGHGRRAPPNVCVYGKFTAHRFGPNWAGPCIAHATLRPRPIPSIPWTDAEGSRRPAEADATRAVCAPGAELLQMRLAAAVHQVSTGSSCSCIRQPRIASRPCLAEFYLMDVASWLRIKNPL